LNFDRRAALASRGVIGPTGVAPVGELFKAGLVCGLFSFWQRAASRREPH
jgi:hypothetical protein